MTQNRTRTSIWAVGVALALLFGAAAATVAQTEVLLVKGNRVGIKTGTTTPGAQLHVVGGGTPIAEPYPGIPLILQNDGAPGDAAFFTLLAGASSNSQMAFGRTGDPFAGQLVYQHVGDYYQWYIQGVVRMTLSATGLVTTTGGTCSPGPCDGIFAPDYEVESIEEHAAYMWENQHLWGVGPTPDDGAINLTKTTTGMLHELEKAHIYIEQLHQRLEKLEARLAAQP